MERQIIILTTSLIVVATLTVVLATSSYKAGAQQTASNHVLVGGGNNTYPFYGYSPQQIEIKAGGSVVWSAPANAPFEPHTVTFVINPKTMATR